MEFFWEAISLGRKKGNRLSIYKWIILLLITSSCGIVFTYYYFLYTHEYPPGSYQRLSTYKADKVFLTRLLITT